MQRVKRSPALAEPGFSGALKGEREALTRALKSLDEMHNQHRAAGMPLDTEGENAAYTITIKARRCRHLVVGIVVYQYV